MYLCERSGRILRITGTGGPDDVYLVRYYLVRSKYFNIFIHQFLRSDRDDLHDHPWDFFTYLVRGEYVERKWDPKAGKIVETFRSNMPWRRFPIGRVREKPQNRLVVRRAEDQHQVVVLRDLKLADKDKAALTICVTGPTRREWGFIKEEYVHCGYVGGTIRKWIDWRTYLGLDKNAPGRG
jgi:hypothetical protein